MYIYKCEVTGTGVGGKQATTDNKNMIISIT
jgi:hypothetical protein